MTITSGMAGNLTAWVITVRLSVVRFPRAFVRAHAHQSIIIDIRVISDGKFFSSQNILKIPAELFFFLIFDYIVE